MRIREQLVHANVENKVSTMMMTMMIKVFRFLCKRSNGSEKRIKRKQEEENAGGGGVRDSPKRKRTRRETREEEEGGERGGKGASIVKIFFSLLGVNTLVILVYILTILTCN